MSSIPNVFAVGGARCGTTFLYNYLKRHPQCYVSPELKELNFMAMDGGLPPLAGPADEASSTGASVTELSEYRRHFEGWGDEPRAADVSPYYLVVPEAAQRIREHRPDAKILISLRNPAECAFSMYALMKRHRREDAPSFRAAFERSHERAAKGWEWGWNLAETFRFGDQVERYLKLFPRENIRVVRYSRLASEPGAFLREICDFLEIDEFRPKEPERQANRRENKLEVFLESPLWQAVRPLNQAAGKVLDPVRKPIRRALAKRKALTLSARDRRFLQDHFLADTEKLEELLGWDLSEWKNG